jgi:hypothetical protein
MTDVPGLAAGDRALFTSVVGPRGKQCDVQYVFGARPRFASVRFDNGNAMLALAADLHPVPRRPPPDFD